MGQTLQVLAKCCAESLPDGNLSDQGEAGGETFAFEFAPEHFHDGPCGRCRRIQQKALGPEDASPVCH